MRRLLYSDAPLRLLLVAAVAFCVWSAGPSVAAVWPHADIGGTRVWLPLDARVVGSMSGQPILTRMPDGTLAPVINGTPRPGAPWPETEFLVIECGGARAFVGLRSKRVVSTYPAGAELRFAWLAAQLRG